MTYKHKDLLIKSINALKLMRKQLKSWEEGDAIIAALQSAIDTPDPKPFVWYSSAQDECMSHALRLEHERLNTYTHRVGDYNTPLYLYPQQ